MNKQNALISLVAVAVLVASATFGFSIPARASIGPVTNTSVNTRASGTVAGPYTLFTGVITQSTRGPSPSWVPSATYDRIDIEYVVQNSNTASQTITATLQHSNDNVNWVSNSACVLTATAASTIDGRQCQNFMYDTAMYIQLATTDPVTVTAVGIYK